MSKFKKHPLFEWERLSPWMGLDLGPMALVEPPLLTFQGLWGKVGMPQSAIEEKEPQADNADD